jgi:hypothetical protein
MLSLGEGGAGSHHNVGTISLAVLDIFQCGNSFESNILARKWLAGKNFAVYFLLNS